MYFVNVYGTYSIVILIALTVPFWNVNQLHLVFVDPHILLIRSASVDYLSGLFQAVALSMIKCCFHLEFPEVYHAFYLILIEGILLAVLCRLFHASIKLMLPVVLLIVDLKTVKNDFIKLFKERVLLTNVANNLVIHALRYGSIKRKYSIILIFDTYRIEHLPDYRGFI